MSFHYNFFKLIYSREYTEAKSELLITVDRAEPKPDEVALRGRGRIAEESKPSISPTTGTGDEFNEFRFDEIDVRREPNKIPSVSEI
uniref:Bm529 n=1 Tax=Brugia malayi TaxID=6279 RepID=A0A1I9G364_BRUMA|nr:Bm529 [Brugia malayi]